ncbi:hypothetical protein Tco_1090725 [Tanacetum coccineum]|uniref:Retrotransposon gag domain-containing protein n=1 Tax=Tanacetum coccineum TaxID=301880 RepID=A0ABQ5I526_9ASTR
MTGCLMLGSMTPELHRQFELHYPYDMLQELRSMFEKQAGVEKFDLIQSFYACKQGKPVVDYVLKIKGYMKKLERLGYVLPQDITIGLILNGLTKDFVGFPDAGFETDKDDIKSQTGYVFVLNGGAVDWKSSKQSTTAMSLQN